VGSDGVTAGADRVIAGAASSADIVGAAGGGAIRREATDASFAGAAVGCANAVAAGGSDSSGLASRTPAGKRDVTSGGAVSPCSNGTRAAATRAGLASGGAAGLTRCCVAGPSAAPSPLHTNSQGSAMTTARTIVPAVIRPPLRPTFHRLSGMTFHRLSGMTFRSEAVGGTGGGGGAKTRSGFAAGTVELDDLFPRRQPGRSAEMSNVSAGTTRFASSEPDRRSRSG
jgi:hypothetical protein